MHAARRAAALTADELLTGLSAPWIDERRGQVEELSLRAREIEAQAALESGSPADAERAARRMIERAPYRESAHALLMEALAARGNVAEATLAYDRLRTLLRDELGTAPAPAVVALHDRLLERGQAAPAPAPDAAAPLPVALARAAGRPFVARAAELERLRSAWTAATAGEAQLVLLAGEPGIGKTSLAARFAREAHASGATVLLGRCHAEALVPYEPFVEALRQLPDAVLREHRAGARAAHAGARARTAPRRSAATTPPPARCSSTRSAARSPPPRARPRWSSCSTTCTGPSRRRCCCCGTSRARPSRSACCCSRPTARPSCPAPSGSCGRSPT